MAASNFESPATCAKIVALVFGVIVLALGIYSHFNSSWTEDVTVPGVTLPGGENAKLYKVCKAKDKIPVDFTDRTCPSISLEHFYISVIIICFILSVLGMAVGFFADLRVAPIKYVDIGYHVGSAVLLAVAGGLYVISAVQIDSFLFGSNGEPEDLPQNIHFRKWEKIGAAFLTFMWALTHGIVVELIVRC